MRRRAIVKKPSKKLFVIARNVAIGVENLILTYSTQLNSLLFIYSVIYSFTLSVCVAFSAGVYCVCFFLVSIYQMENAIATKTAKQCFNVLGASEFFNLQHDTKSKPKQEEGEAHTKKPVWYLHVCQLD